MNEIPASPEKISKIHDTLMTLWWHFGQSVMKFPDASVLLLGVNRSRTRPMFRCKSCRPSWLAAATSSLQAAQPVPGLTSTTGGILSTWSECILTPSSVVESCDLKIKDSTVASGVAQLLQPRLYLSKLLTDHCFVPSLWFYLDFTEW